MPLEGELGFSQNVFREEKVWCSDVFSLCSRKLHWLMPTDIWKTIFSFMPNLAKKNLRFSWLNQIYQYLRCIQNLSGSLGWANTLQQMANRPTQNDFQHLKVKMGRKERMEGGRSTYISAFVHNVREICYFISFSFEALLNFNFQWN